MATLMSNLIRSTVCNSIKDLIDLVEDYHEGNAYEGDYDIFKDLALPQKIHPVTIFMVIIILFFLPVLNFIKV
jgi:hypothetical protein